MLHHVRPLHDETGRDAGPFRYVAYHDRLRAETVDTGETPPCPGLDRQNWGGKATDDESLHLMIPEIMDKEKIQELIVQRPTTTTATPAMIAV